MTMKLMTFAFAKAVLAGSEWIFNYTNMGYDWPYAAIPPDDFTGVNRCGEPNN